MPFTIAIHHQMINAALRGVAFSGWSTVYFGLHTANPTDAGTSEVAGGSYARQSGTFAAASGGQCSNAAGLSFGPLPAVTVTHWSVWSAASGGTQIAYGQLSTPRTVTAGDLLTAAAGQLVVKLTQAS